MKPITIEFEVDRLKVLCGLVSLAGSKLGDQSVMMSSAEMLNWMQVQVDAAQAAQKASKPYLVEDGQPDTKVAHT